MASSNGQRYDFSSMTKWLLMQIGFSNIQYVRFKDDTEQLCGYHYNVNANCTTTAEQEYMVDLAKQYLFPTYNAIVANGVEADQQHRFWKSWMLHCFRTYTEKVRNGRWKQTKQFPNHTPSRNESQIQMANETPILWKDLRMRISFKMLPTALSSGRMRPLTIPLIQTSSDSNNDFDEHSSILDTWLGIENLKYKIETHWIKYGHKDDRFESDNFMICASKTASKMRISNSNDLRTAYNRWVSGREPDDHDFWLMLIPDAPAMSDAESDIPDAQNPFVTSSGRWSNPDAVQEDFDVDDERVVKRRRS